MKIVHRANTCFSIFEDDFHILFDPWLDGPAVAQGWAHFPPSEYTISQLPCPDLLYISHIHDDHCESTTLNGINNIIATNNLTAKSPNAHINHRGDSANPDRITIFSVAKLSS